MRPLAGRTVLVTRARDQAGRLVAALAERGARVIEAPVIDFEDPADWTAADAAARRVDIYDIVIFTSANAADRFLRRLADPGASFSSPHRPLLVAIGPATAEALASRGLAAGRIAPVARVEGVIDLLAGDELSGKRILIPRAEAAREILPDQLRGRGAQVDVVTVYRTVAAPLAPEVRRLIESGAVDVVTFTSSSTVTNLLAAVGGPGALRGIGIAVIGPVTGRTAREAGLTPTIVSPGTRMDDLAEAIAAHYASSR